MSNLDPYIKDFPKSKTIEGGPNGLSFMSPTVMRYVSLQAAQNGEKVALAANKGRNGKYIIFGQKITSPSTTNDKWKTIQLVVGVSPFFYMYHCETGLCLARNSNNELTLTNVKNLQYVDINNNLEKTNGPFGVWTRLGDERAIYLMAPDVAKPDTSKSYCITGTDANITIGAECDPKSKTCGTGEKCLAPLDFCINPETKKKKPKIFQPPSNPSFGGNPIKGNVYILLGNNNGNGNYNVSIGPPDDTSIPQLFCTGVVQQGNKSHAWYLLEQQDPSNIPFAVPVRSGMSLGEFFSWDPTRDVNSQFNVSRQKIIKRFYDSSTQTVPEQTPYPKITAITQSPNAVDCLIQTTGHLMFQRTNTINWQYIDIYANFGGDQGFAPDEFKNITPENMGVQGDLSQIGPGPLSGPESGKYMTNTENLYAYIDGKRSAGLGGRVSLPPKWMTDACHKNGVKCFGSIFFQEVYYGGKWGWWVQFCQDPELSAKRMADICDYYGFDGWLFNFETGPPDEPLNKNWPGQVYKGMNVFTAKPADEYWCNVLAGAKYPAWKHTDMDCGRDTNWPCSCANPAHSGTWPAPGYTPGSTPGDECGTREDKYTQGCNRGWTLRQNMIKMIKIFNKYRDSKGIKAELMVYDTIQVSSPYGVGISTVDPTICPDGINNLGNCFGNMDFWWDQDGKVADNFYSMRSGVGGMEPSCSPLGVTSTYILSSNNIVEGFTQDYKLEKGWPRDTGPTAGGHFCVKADHSNLNKQCQTNADCGTNTMCAMMDPQTGQGYCTPYLFSDYMCNYGKAPKVVTGMSIDRPYDYYQAVQLENITPSQVGPIYTLENIASFLALITQRGSPQGWDSAIYCGTQSKNLPALRYGNASGSCVNEERAVEKPLGSLNLYYVDTFYRWYNKFANIPGYPSKQALTDWVIQNQLVFYTGARFLTPENRINTGTSAHYWKGLSHYVAERSVIQNYPFYTTFCIGNGPDFWIDGKRQNFGEWNNWSMQTILPTWMWWPDSEDILDANYMKISFDVEDAYERSNSLSFSTTTDISSWLRGGTPTPTATPTAGSCTVPNTAKVDCKIDNPQACKSAGCCWDDSVDPNKYPYCYHKSRGGGGGGGSHPIPPLQNKKSVQASYRLFKTSLSLQKGCMISLVYKGKKSANSGLRLGYSTRTWVNEPIYIDIPLTDGDQWETFVTTIPASSKTMVIIWLSVRLPLDFVTKINIGELCVTDKKIDKIEDISFNITHKFVATETSSTSYVLSWKPIKNVEYFNIFMNNNLVGHVYQGIDPRNKILPLTYVTHNAPPDASFSVEPSTNHAKFVKTKLEKLLWLWIVLGVLYAIGLGIVIFFFVKRIRAGKDVKLWIAILATLVALPIIVGLILWGRHIAAKHTGALSQAGKLSEYSVEYWQHCKPHSFNACFDDSRVKCWSWLIHMWKKKKWPIKFSFFYNTLWLPRDWYTFKDWISLGHEICCHGHDHICACQTDFGKGFPDAAQYIADNDAQCAKLIRKLYGDPNRELMLAWPHGAYPLIYDPKIPCKGQDCGPNNGTPRPKVIKMLEETFIAARGAPYTTQVNTWPNPAALTGKYPNEYWPYALSPRWGWPYQIDINPGSDMDIPKLCKQYETDFHKGLAVKNSMMIVAGHDFAPTDSEGRDVPCSWQSASQFTDGPYKDGSWCKNPSDCQNTFVCPKDVSDITKGCWWNPGKAPQLPLPLYINNDQRNGILAPPLPPPKNLGLQAPPQPGKKPTYHGSGAVNCNQCCDACWNPVPGSCIINLFDEVTKNKDIFWFATFTEIIQYTNNRQNSQLLFNRSLGTTTYLTLDCKKMYNCDLTISFGGDPLDVVTIDGKNVDVYYSDLVNKYYIKFRPKTNVKHKIKVTKK